MAMRSHLRLVIDRGQRITPIRWNPIVQRLYDNSARPLGPFQRRGGGRRGERKGRTLLAFRAALAHLSASIRLSWILGKTLDKRPDGACLPAMVGYNTVAGCSTFKRPPGLERGIERK
jgi:hypothetical protein